MSKQIVELNFESFRMLIACWHALSIAERCGIITRLIWCSANCYFINNCHFRDFSWKGVIKYG